MKHGALLLLAALLAGPASAAPGELYHWPVREVIDGDTISVEIPGLPRELQPVKIRVLGIDTPERGGRAKCAREREMATKATALTRFLVGDAQKHKRPIGFSKIGWDKYGGRVDAEVTIDGRSLSRTLIAAGLARPYDGGKRSGWCS